MSNAAVVLFLFFFISCARAQGEKGTFSFYLENDTRNIGGPGTDQSYSNGFRASYLFAEDKVPAWAEPMIDWSDSLKKQLQKSQTNFSISLGQQIYTPSNTRSTELIVDDRPYAAWLYVGFMANFKTEAHSQLVELSLGVIGKEAMGKEIQNGFHRMIDIEQTEGWDHQLQTEPTLQVSYQQRIKFFELHRESERYFDAIPYYGGAIGNVNTSAHIGGVIRFGRNLIDDFGPTRPSGGDGDSYIPPADHAEDKTAGKQPSYYVFAGARGNGIIRNIFLDGSTFRSSQRVKKYPFVGETEFGIGTQWRDWSFVWRFVTRSPEFEERSTFNSFASITISVSDL